MALETPEAFFPLLDKLTDSEVLPLPEKLTPEAAHQAVLEIATANGYLTEPGSLAAVELNLALHAATPKIEAFYNHYIDHYNNTKGTNCGSWVEWYGEIVCDIETLVKLAGVETIDPTAKSSSSSPFPRPRLLTFDHIHPSPARSLTPPPRTAILYASPTSKNFRELHSYLLNLAEKENPHVEYVFRYVAPTGRDDHVRNYLSGYGVALNLKKTDYLAIDDRNGRNGGNGENTSKHDNSVSDADPILSLIDNHPMNDTAPSAKTPLTEEEYHNIGHKAIQLIADSPNPLATLKQLSQNFPKYATTLARRVVVNSSLDEELQANGMKAQGGGHMFWLNGAFVSDKDINPFGLLRLLKKERAAMLSLTSLGLTRTAALELLTHPLVAAAQAGGDVLDGLIDATDRTEGGDVVVYWNDMEKDRRYQKWSTSVYTLIRPVYHGIPSVKYNVFNVILILDLSQANSLAFIAGQMANLIDRNIPLRFGLVPISETEDKAQPIDKPTIDWGLVGRLFADFSQVEGTETHTVAELDDILSGKVSPLAPLGKVKAYVERLGATLSACPTGHVFFNGKHFDYNEEFLQHIQNELSRQLQFFQEKIYSGKITDEQEGLNDTLATYFYDQPTTSLRRNRYIYPTGAPGSLRVFNLVDLFARTGFRVAPSAFLYPPETTVIPLTIYVVADLDSLEGLKLVKEALLSISPGSRTRISFIHNPANSPSEGTDRPLASWLIAHLVKTHLVSKTPPEYLLRALGVGGPSTEAQTLLSQDEVIRALTEGVKVADFNPIYYADYVQASRMVVREIGVAPGQQALLVNGRVVGPIEGGDFLAADFSALENYEIRKGSEPIITALETISPSSSLADRASYANLLSMAASAIGAIQLPDPSEFSLLQTPQRPRNRQYQMLDSKYTAFKAGDNSTALFHIAVILDPLSVTGQKWSSLLEMPLKSFYRYNLLSSLNFKDDGQEVGAQAIFEDLPTEPIYTLAMDVPSSWLVRPREALYDLDNIQLGNLSPEDNGVKAVFDLDYLVVEGHAREAHNNSPPRGVQLELLRGGEEASAIDDTQVVANLGYFQFKAKPGVFGLEIRKGRGRDVYEMESAGNEGWDSPSTGESGNEITLTSFEGLTLYPRLARKPNMEKADVLTQPQPDSNLGSFFGDLTSRVASLFKQQDVAPHVEEQADINIFTVASGLLYELANVMTQRFASIMILSVLRNTKSTVKFWFIENFLSPSFLEFIPHLAEKYNFKYELVTYKWPSWLREQTEKQRIIWAYKILFLDVLFPMDLKKVIFVDADQIVRADLQELVDLDLHGAPYGYTPMGDDNTDMEGFRFWKTGYWKEFLQGRPYHISALYVIDLVRFRQVIGGRRKPYIQPLARRTNTIPRIYYEGNINNCLLTPTHWQIWIKIYQITYNEKFPSSRWAKIGSGVKLGAAKIGYIERKQSISVKIRSRQVHCRNINTAKLLIILQKEPKLVRARQIPEWEEYDHEIAQFARQLAEAGVIHSGLATADTNVLANAGAALKETGDTSDTKVEDPSANPSVPERDEL
ncbi:hypothetical protein DXG01_013034 [Tephrocybe rancida]|nr:hypothetical protein DXG01_013034 [Tephrocybe rancida]